MSTFLVSRTDAIGDVVLTLPVCGRLKQLFPGCRVVLIGRTYTEAVAAACPWIDDFLNFEQLNALPKDEQIRLLQSYQADAILHIFPNRLLAGLARRARIPLRIGTRNRVFHWFTCNRLVALSRRHSPLHEAQLNLQLLDPLHASTELLLPQVAALVRLHAPEPLAPKWQQLLTHREAEQLNVVLHPRSRGSAREWGLLHFGTLARLLHAKGHRVFVTGTAAEGEELREWLTEHQSYLAADLTGCLTLPQLLAFLSKADGLIAGSTGPLHLSAGLGRYALGLYPPIRPMHPGRWAPLGPRAEYLVFDLPNCQNCRRQPTACTCIKAISPLQVAQHILTWQPMLNLPS